MGIRRAAQVKSGAKVSVACNQQMNDIASVVNAVSMKRVFNLCYNPRYIVRGILVLAMTVLVILSTWSAIWFVMYECISFLVMCSEFFRQHFLEGSLPMILTHIFLHTAIHRIV